jgi:hypothetical protein
MIRLLPEIDSLIQEIKLKKTMSDNMQSSWKAQILDW